MTEPLARMGATFAGRAGGTLLPLAITGRARLSAIRSDAPVPSAQVSTVATPSSAAPAANAARATGVAPWP